MTGRILARIKVYGSGCIGKISRPGYWRMDTIGSSGTKDFDWDKPITLDSLMSDEQAGAELNDDEFVVGNVHLG